MSRPTLQTIADALGLSKAAVSLALRDRPKISPATRERVRAEAERIGYRPDPAVQRIARGRRRGEAVDSGSTLAFLVDQSRQFPFARLYGEGAAAEAERLGYRLAFFNLTEHHPRDLSRRLVLRGIRGVLACLPQRLDGCWELDWSKFTVVQCGRGRIPATFHKVAEHTSLAVQMGVERAVDDEHRR